MVTAQRHPAPPGLLGLDRTQLGREAQVRRRLRPGADDLWLPGLESVEPYGPADAALFEFLVGPFSADVLTFLPLAHRGDGRVLDLGSGDGRLALPLARHGFDVDAVDRDRAALIRLDQRYRQVRAGRARLGRVAGHHADLRDVDLPEPAYGLVLLAGCVLAALTAAARLRLFQRVAGALAAGGRLAFDYCHHEPVAVRQEPERLWAFRVPRFDGVEQTVIAEQQLDLDRGTETISYFSEETGGGQTRRRTWTTVKQLIDPATVRAELAAAGLTVETSPHRRVGPGVTSTLMVCRPAGPAQSGGGR